MAGETSSVPSVVRGIVQHLHLGKADCIKQYQPKTCRQQRRDNPLARNSHAVVWIGILD